jgi:hypothetical protein
MLHGTRRRCDGSRRQVDIAVVRALNGWPTRRREFGQRGHEGAEQGGLGEDGPDRWVPSVSNGGAVTSWQADSRAEMGQGRRRARPTAKKTAHNDFFYFKFLF